MTNPGIAHLCHPYASDGGKDGQRDDYGLPLFLRESLRLRISVAASVAA